jgi:probable HAF family extracellular repeat protein
MQRLSRLYTALILSLLTVCFASAAPAQTTYTITDLGTLPGGNRSLALGINASGQVTGGSNGVSGVNHLHVFLYSYGTMTDLGSLPGGNDSYGAGINDSGQVTGQSGNDNSGFTPFLSGHAFLYSGGKMIDLGTLPGGAYSVGAGINASGQVTGDSDGTGFGQHAFLYSGGKMTDLGTLPGGTYSVGAGINASGQVTGQSGVSGNIYHAFLYSSGTMTDLGTLPGGTYSYSSGINASGQVTGGSDNSTSGGWPHAFVYSSGTMTDLGTLTGGTYSYSFGLGINASGQVVGVSYPGFNGGAFLYSSGTMTDLNTLLPANSGWALEAALAINDAGQITGFGEINNLGHAFLLTPVPTITALMNLVQSFHLPFGIRNSLLAKLKFARAAGPGSASCPDLSDFIREVHALSGKKLTTAQAHQLIAMANQIKTALDCP